MKGVRCFSIGAKLFSVCQKEKLATGRLPNYCQLLNTKSVVLTEGKNGKKTYWLIMAHDRRINLATWIGTSPYVDPMIDIEYAIHSQRGEP